MEIDSDSDSQDSTSPPNTISHNPQALPPTAATPSTTTITPSTRITELNEIDTSISTLLSSASLAASILANLPSAQTQPQTQSLAHAQSTFTSAASTYFSTLSSIEVRLRRQVYALEEAGLIPVGDERDTRRGRTLNSEDAAVAARSGGGPLDASWLNARASEKVEEGMKRELLVRARELIGEMEREGKVMGDVEMGEEV